MVAESSTPLAVAGLSKTFVGPFGFPRFLALSDVGFAIEAGRVLGLIGPNGAGKTTAIRCALGLVRSSRGTVRLFGRPPLSKGARRSVGFAPESFEPAAWRTGQETLELFGVVSGLSIGDARLEASRLLDRFELTSARKRRVGSYSKGMRRRLAIAQALLGDPKLVVLDEPFDGLDPLGAMLVRDEIEARKKRGVAILISSHQLADVEAVATDLVVMHHGRVVANGTMSQVLDRAGVARIEVEGLDAAALDSLELEIGRRGGRITQRRPARESLEDLFRRLVSKRDERGER